MSVLVVGDETHANLAGDTGMVAFGPLHYAGRGRDASAEMEAFLEALYDDIGVDPRNLTDRSLRNLHIEARFDAVDRDGMLFPDLKQAKDMVETTR